MRRLHDPYKGRWALPGGFVELEEDLEPAARRELHEETGVDIRRVRLRQLGAYGAPHRDPRGRTITIAFFGVSRRAPAPVAADDAAEAAWVEVDRLLRARPGMAFDHARMIRDGLRALGSG